MGSLFDVQIGIDYGTMAKAQQQYPELHTYHTTASKLQVKDVPFGTDGVTLLCDV